MSSTKTFNWNEALIGVIGHEPPSDSVELRNSFLEAVMLDKDGKPIKQASLHEEIQRTVFRWETDGYRRGVIRAPYNSGKSQQLPIGLAVYLATRKPELEQLIISSDASLSKKRILAIRALVESNEYKYWCKQNNFRPLSYGKRDTGSTEFIIFESRNRTGNPSFEAHGVLTGGTGQRASYVWLDDICSDKDRHSKAHRDAVFERTSNVWIKRVHDKGFVYGICTPYHPQDANSRLAKSGSFCVLQIAVNDAKTGYTLTEWLKE